MSGGAERAARRIADDLDQMCKKHNIELEMFPTCLARWAAIIREDTGTQCTITASRCHNFGNELYEGHYSILCHKPGCLPAAPDEGGKR